MDCKGKFGVAKGVLGATMALATMSVALAGCAASFGLGCVALVGMAATGTALVPGGGLETMAGCPKPDLLSGQAEIMKELSAMGKQLDELTTAAGFSDIGKIRCNFFYVFGELKH